MRTSQPWSQFRAAVVTMSCLLGILSIEAEPCEDCVIPPVLMSPGGSLEYTVYIEHPEGGPWEDATVSVVFPPETCDLLVLCQFPDAACDTFPTYTATTDSNGRATFNIAGGGCWDETECSSGAYLVKVKVEGETVAEVGVRSPDAVFGTGNLSACQLWCETTVTTVSLGDATWLSTPFSGPPFVICADMNGDGDVGLADAVLATGPIKIGETCEEP